MTPHGEPYFEVGQVWVEPREPLVPPTGPSAQFGEHIALQSVVYDEQAAVVKLYWQPNAPITQDYSIFLHLRDAAGNIIGQVDGAPYDNRYRISDWRTGQLIEDVRSIKHALGHAPTVTDQAQIHQFAIGVYLPTTGERLPATNNAGQPLADNMLLVPVE